MQSVFDIFSASSEVVHSNKCFLLFNILYAVLISAFIAINILSGTSVKSIKPLSTEAFTPSVVSTNLFVFTLPFFFEIIKFNISRNIGISTDINAITKINARFIFNIIAINKTNKKHKNTEVSCLLLTILQNILYLLSKFNGLFFITPFLFSIFLFSHCKIW